MRIHNANPSNVARRLQALVKDYPPHPQYGIDYSQAVNCPIVTCAIFYGDETLLVHRGANVAEYPNTWATLGGFLLPQSPIGGALEEMQEEAGITPDDIADLYVLPMRVRLDPELRLNSAPPYKYKRRWYEFRCMAELSTRVTPIANWENREVAWLPFKQAMSLPLLPSARRTLRMWQRARQNGTWPTSLGVL